jgi:hypothetical protein
MTSSQLGPRHLRRPACRPWGKGLCGPTSPISASSHHCAHAIGMVNSIGSKQCIPMYLRILPGYRGANALPFGRSDCRGVTLHDCDLQWLQEMPVDADC